MAIKMTTHSRRSISIRGMAALTVCLLGFGACTTNSQKSGTKPKAGGTVTWAKPQDVVATDPATDAGGNGADWEMYNLVYETLVTLDDDLRPAPSLAKSWKQESPTVYVFSLRDDAKFSDGRQLTAADVVGSLSRLNDPKLASAWAGQLGIKTVKADDPKTVRITLRRPKVSFLGGLAGPMASILPIKELDAKSFDPGKAMLGSGPYMVKNHVQDTSWTLVRNPYHRGRGVGPDTIAVKIMPEDAARVAALRDGSADVSVFGNPDAARILKGQRDITTKVQETTDAYRIDINEKSSIFSDDRLRQALASSIDRKQIAAIALGGVGVPSAAVAPAFGKCSVDSLYGSPDLAKATSLVAQAGATGKRVTIQASTSGATYKPIAQVLAQSLEKIGLKVTIEQPPPGEWVKKVFGPTPHFDLSLSYFGGYGDPGMVLNYYDPSKAEFNKAFLKSDPNVNAAVEAANVTPPGSKRDAALAKACQEIASTVGIIPLVTRPNTIAYRSDRITADIQNVEAYSVPLRHLASFGVR